MQLLTMAGLILFMAAVGGLALTIVIGIPVWILRKLIG